MPRCLTEPVVTSAPLQGTLEVTQIRKAGLNVRRPLKPFFMYYKLCAEDASALRAPTLRERVQMLMTQLELDAAKFRVGKTLLFLQNCTRAVDSVRPSPRSDHCFIASIVLQPCSHSCVNYFATDLLKLCLAPSVDELLDELDKLREVKIVEHVIRLQSLTRACMHVLRYRDVRRKIRRIQEYFIAKDTRLAYLEVRQAARLIQRVGRGAIVRRLIVRLSSQEEPRLERHEIAPEVRSKLNQMSGRAEKEATRNTVTTELLRCTVARSGWV